MGECNFFKNDFDLSAKNLSSLKENNAPNEVNNSDKIVQESPPVNSMLFDFLRMRSEYKTKFLFVCLSICTGNKRTLQTVRDCIETTGKIIWRFDYSIMLHFIFTALKSLFRKYINND